MPLPAVPLSPIGRFYLIEVDHKDGSYMTETDHLPRGKDLTKKDGLALLQQADEPRAIFEVIPNEGYVRDCSEDMARDWLDEFYGDEADVPEFITANLDPDEIAHHFAEVQSWERDRPSLSSPQAMGRV